MKNWKMGSDLFLKRKKDILEKLDKSSIGNWDKMIISLCNKINKSKDYYTTSSCAGRILLMIDKDKKGPGVFLWVSHNLIKLKELKSALNSVNFTGFVKFKQEPAIMHVACRSLQSAQTLIDKAKFVGWKRSGIIASGKRFVVELMGTEKLEFLIMNGGRVLVDDFYLELVVKKSNENLLKTWKKIEGLKKLV